MYHGYVNEADRSPSTTRQEARWYSTVFEGPIIEEVRRKKLGKFDAGVDALFGKDKSDYTSSNLMASINGGKKHSSFTKAYIPVRQQKTAEQRKIEEVYGKAAVVYGTGSKGDGTLMADCADWRNPQ